MKPVFALLILMSGLAGCSGKKRGSIQVLSALQQMEELATVEYKVTKVVKANDNKTWFKPGDRKILITTEAVMKAGINLAELEDDDVTVSGKTITIQLPEPKILSVNMPPDKIKVAFEKRELLRYPFNNEERDALLKQAEKSLLESGDDTGILSQAKLNTQVLITRLLTNLGFETIRLRFGIPENKQPKG